MLLIIFNRNIICLIHIMCTIDADFYNVNEEILRIIFVTALFILNIFPNKC